MKITSLPLLYNFPQADDKAQHTSRVNKYKKIRESRIRWTINFLYDIFFKVQQLHLPPVQLLPLLSFKSKEDCCQNKSELSYNSYISQLRIISNFNLEKFWRGRDTRTHLDQNLNLLKKVRTLNFFWLDLKQQKIYSGPKHQSPNKFFQAMYELDCFTSPFSPQLVANSPPLHNALIQLFLPFLTTYILVVSCCDFVKMCQITELIPRLANKLNEGVYQRNFKLTNQSLWIIVSYCSQLRS